MVARILRMRITKLLVLPAMWCCSGSSIRLFYSVVLKIQCTQCWAQPLLHQPTNMVHWRKKIPENDTQKFLTLQNAIVWIFNSWKMLPYGLRNFRHIWLNISSNMLYLCGECKKGSRPVQTANGAVVIILSQPISTMCLYCTVVLGKKKKWFGGFFPCILMR